MRMYLCMTSRPWFNSHSEKFIAMAAKLKYICSWTDQTVCCQFHNARLLYLTTNSDSRGRKPMSVWKRHYITQLLSGEQFHKTCKRKWTELNNYSCCCCSFCSYYQQNSNKFTLILINSFNLQTLSVAQTTVSSGRWTVNWQGCVKKLLQQNLRC